MKKAMDKTMDKTMNKIMNKTLTLLLACILPAIASGQIVKIGGEFISRTVKTGAKGAASPVTTGVTGAMLRGLEVPIARAAGNIAPAVPAMASKVVTLPPLAQQLKDAVTTAQIANTVLFAAPTLTSGYAMDSYPADLQLRAQEVARISAQQLPLPLTSSELRLLAAADTQGKFVEVDPNLEEGVVVATFRQKIHVNVSPGSFMARTDIGRTLKIEKSEYASLQKEVKNMSAQAIADLKHRAGISYLEGNRKFLEYDEFRGLVSTGDSKFFGAPILAHEQNASAPVDMVRVFFPVKKNLIVRANFVFYSLPAGSYVCMDAFNGEIGNSHFLFDAQPLMIPLSQKEAKKLQRSISGIATQKPVFILVEGKGAVKLTDR